MTIQEMHEYFDLLTDKVGDPYFLSSEKDTFLNMAQNKYIKDMLPSSEGGVVNLELDSVIQNNIHTLIYQTGTLTSTSGEITTNTVNAALQALSQDEEDFMYVMNVSWTKSGATYPVKFTKHNDWYAQELNTFKKGKATRPKYKFFSDKFTFSPVDGVANIQFTLLKNPVAVSLDNGVNCELPEHTHKLIVELAVNEASTSIRDPQLRELNG